MLREEKSRKRFQSFKKLDEPGLAKSSTSTNIALKNHKYIKEVPTHKEGMTEFIYELKDVISHLQKRSSEPSTIQLVNEEKLKNYSSINIMENKHLKQSSILNSSKLS